MSNMKRRKIQLIENKSFRNIIIIIIIIIFILIV